MIDAPARHPYLAHDGPVALAHRGGGLESPENSRTAFVHALDLGYRYLETDVRATRDGVLVVFHDATLDRVTDAAGAVALQPWDQVRTARTAGGDRLMSLAETLEEFPAARFNIDLKSHDTVEPFLALVHESPALLDRICVGSFSDSRLRRVRAELGSAVATSMGPREVASLVAHRRGAPARLVPSAPVAAQVPVRAYGLPLVDAGFVRRAHEHDIAVHVWTVDEADQMHALLDLGVDGIVTDRPSVLREVLLARGLWRQTP